MSKRRRVGELVWIGAEGDERFLGRIDPRAAEQVEKCPHTDRLDHDPYCKNWPTVEVLTDDGESAGGYCYHVNECEMHDYKETVKHQYKLFFLEPGVVMMTLSHIDAFGAKVLKDGKIAFGIPWAEMPPIYAAIDAGRLREVPSSQQTAVREQFLKVEHLSYVQGRYDLLCAELDEPNRSELAQKNLPAGAAANLEAAKKLLRRSRGS